MHLDQYHGDEPELQAEREYNYELRYQAQSEPEYWDDFDNN